MEIPAVTLAVERLCDIVVAAFYTSLKVDCHVIRRCHLHREREWPERMESTM